MPLPWASGRGQAGHWGLLACSLSVLGAFLKYKEGAQATSVPMKYFSALIIFIISVTPLQSLITLISLKCEDEISNGMFNRF